MRSPPVTPRPSRRTPRTLLRAAQVLALSLLVAACGVGSESTVLFGLEGIGPQGGTVKVGDVLLVVSPGALVQETAVAILPDKALPIQPPVNDPCLYALLGPVWCCGPVGQDLLVASALQITYDEALIPAGVVESDLVLLLWDDAAQVLRPRLNGVFHDPFQNFFQIADYVELGHVAVGIRTCLARAAPPVLFNGNAGGAQNPVLAGTVPNASGLYVAISDNSAPPVQLPTDDQVPETFVAAPDGSRVLFSIPIPNFETSIWRTVPVEGGAPVTVVDVDHRPEGSDPMAGWMRDSTEVYFQESVRRVAGGQATAGQGLALGEYVSRASADGSAAPQTLYFLGSFNFGTDVRQSDDGTTFLLRSINFASELEERLDAFDRATGSPLSVGVLPIGGQQTPRFVPGSTDVYGVDPDGLGVTRYEADGSVVSQVLSVEVGAIQDFLLAPDGDHYAMILRVESKGEVDELHVGTLTEGETGQALLGSPTSYAEMVFHPDGVRILLDASGIVRVFLAADATEEPSLPVHGLFDVDIERETGEVLFVVPPVLTDSAWLTALGPGLYVAPADLSTVHMVDTPNLVPTAARWLHSIRTAPGMGFQSRVR